MSSNETRVSFVGAGQMGGPMVHRLLDAGVPTTVYARRAEVREQFERAGAPVVATLPDAARDADVVLVCVYSDTEVDDVALGPNGLIASMAPGAVLALHTTGSPATARRLAEDGRGSAASRSSTRRSVGVPTTSAPGGSPSCWAVSPTMSHASARWSLPTATPSSPSAGWAARRRSSS